MASCAPVVYRRYRRRVTNPLQAASLPHNGFSTLPPQRQLCERALTWMDRPGGLSYWDYRWMRAEPPLAKARTWSSVAIVVSPGKVVSSAPCAQPSFTASSGDSPVEQAVEEARRRSRRRRRRGRSTSSSAVGAV